MEKHQKCMACGTILIATMVSGAIVANTSICEPCRKKIEEAPHAVETNHTNTTDSTTTYTVMGGLSSTATTTQPNQNIDIKIN
jgi:DNA-directed RNA polymerase subunit M/transcription elongation factor TFIIS